MPAYPFFPTRAAALEAFAADLKELSETRPDVLYRGICTFETEYEAGKPVGYRVLMGRVKGSWMLLDTASDPEAIMAMVRLWSDDYWD